MTPIKVLPASVADEGSSSPVAALAGAENIS